LRPWSASFASAGVTTQAIADRVDAGERVEEIPGDYGLERADIEQAVMCERAARALSCSPARARLDRDGL
jgi:uncharacterized protein (DUF433 family)